jgi:uncharacterized protein
MNKSKVRLLEKNLIELYKQHEKELLFHGWHHISFVRSKAVKFAESIAADVFLVESAALVHDINYIVAPNSEPEVGEGLRQEQLRNAGYEEGEIKRIEEIVLEEHTSTRDAKITPEGKALSDADTLFKALPITPILFASKYIQENNIDISKLAEKICIEQNRLLEGGFYFYTDTAKEMYLNWAKINLQLWNNVRLCLEDSDVKDMLSIAKESKVI